MKLREYKLSFSILYITFFSFSSLCSLLSLSSCCNLKKIINIDIKEVENTLILIFHKVETPVEVWENKKSCGEASLRRMFPQLFLVLSIFHECYLDFTETRKHKCSILTL